MSDNKKLLNALENYLAAVNNIIDKRGYNTPKNEAGYYSSEKRNDHRLIGNDTTQYSEQSIYAQHNICSTLIKVLTLYNNSWNELGFISSAIGLKSEFKAMVSDMRFLGSNYSEMTPSSSQHVLWVVDEDTLALVEVAQALAQIENPFDFCSRFLIDKVLTGLHLDVDSIDLSSIDHLIASMGYVSLADQQKFYEDRGPLTDQDAYFALHFEAWQIQEQIRKEQSVEEKMPLSDQIKSVQAQIDALDIALAEHIAAEPLVIWGVSWNDHGAWEASLHEKQDQKVQLLAEHGKLARLSGQKQARQELVQDQKQVFEEYKKSRHIVYRFFDFVRSLFSWLVKPDRDAREEYIDDLYEQMDDYSEEGKNEALLDSIQMGIDRFKPRSPSSPESLASKLNDLKAHVTQKEAMVNKDGLVAEGFGEAGRVVLPR